MNKEEPINNDKLWDQLEQLIQLEVTKLKKEKGAIHHGLHPEVIKCLNKYTNNGVSAVSNNDKKRSINHDTSENSNKRIRKDINMEDDSKNVGIDMNRYDTDTSNVSLLQSMNSYLDHQLILLRDNGNLNKTIINQWAVNNEFMENNVYMIQDTIDIQETHLKQLNRLLSMN